MSHTVLNHSKNHVVLYNDMRDVQVFAGNVAGHSDAEEVGFKAMFQLVILPHNLSQGWLFSLDDVIPETQDSPLICRSQAGIYNSWHTRWQSELQTGTENNMLMWCRRIPKKFRATLWENILVSSLILYHELENKYFVTNLKVLEDDRIYDLRDAEFYGENVWQTFFDNEGYLLIWCKYIYFYK